MPLPEKISMELMTFINYPLQDDFVGQYHCFRAKINKCDGMYKVIIPAVPDPVVMSLSWQHEIKKGNETKTKSVYLGVFLLYLNNLLQKGYIRLEKSRKDCVRLQIINDDGIIKIAQGKKRGASGLVIGTIRFCPQNIPHGRKKIK